MITPRITMIVGCLLAAQSGYPEPQRIPVTTTPLSAIAFYPTHTAPATAVSLNDAQVSAEISGRLNKIAVSVGDRVKAGDVVASVDCRDAEIALAETQAAYKAGRAKYQFDISQLQKGRTLAKSKNISKDEIDRRTSNAAISDAEVDQLQANVTRAKTSVERCEVKAPFDSVVVERLASIGDFLQRGQSVVRLLDIDNIEVSANIQEKDFSSLQAAQDFELVTRNDRFPLELRTTLPRMDSKLRSFEARFSFTDNVAIAGSAGRLVWHSKTPHIPADLIVNRGTLGLFVLIGNKARFVPQAGAASGVPVATDLDMSTRIIIEGRFNLNDGDVVVVTDL